MPQIQEDASVGILRPGSLLANRIISIAAFPFINSSKILCLFPIPHYPEEASVGILRPGILLYI